jgi:enoyl-CoA hydratase/carnithine racemase
MATDVSAGVQTDITDGVATLRIDGRTHLNLLGPAVVRALVDRVKHCGDDENLSAIVLRGAGDRAFSAGVDLHEMKDLDPLAAEVFIRSLHAAARGLLDAPLPVVACIGGPCLGGALELALACDIRVASDDAIFGLPEVRVGLPSVIEASLLPPTVGLGRARKMILTGETIDAAEALRIGLVDQVVTRDQLDATATGIARPFAGMSRYVLATQKRIISSWLEMGEEDAAEYSIKAFALCFATAHPREAMDAFLEKREPRFGAGPKACVR